MTISVDIADRQYDYTDEEKAEDVVSEFQIEFALNDEAILGLWADEANSKRIELERRIFEAVDANGSAKRAEETIPGGISLSIETEVA